MIGVPKPLTGAMAAAPSSSGPQWHTIMATILCPEPSGAWPRTQNEVSSSGRSDTKSRKLRMTDLSFVEREYDEPTGDHRPNGVEVVLEAGHDAEVASAALERPEEVYVLVA
jgi:hypothetical protein